jgi:hypothetical protein
VELVAFFKSLFTFMPLLTNMEIDTLLTIFAFFSLLTQMAELTIITITVNIRAHMLLITYLMLLGQA